ncbi:MAG: o-succinylbenzoate synthase [Tuberibacillus sp.]
MTLSSIIIRKINMRLKNPFRSSFGLIQDKPMFIVEAIDQDGERGWGESVAFDSPWYTEETVKTTEHIMEDFLIPLLQKGPLWHPDEVTERFKPVRRNRMAKAAMEGAIWDLFARKRKMPLYKALGAVRGEVEVGVSIGIKKEIDELLDEIQQAVNQGYKRIKMKIKPGSDVVAVKEVRHVFPDIPLMVDANSAYTLHDIDLLKKLDEFGLLMIEQPFGHDDLLEHAELQKQIKTPICLDESIYSVEDVKIALKLGSCRIINIKMGRVGGLTEAKVIHDYCYERHIPVWCGGMFEAGIGRLQSLALAALPGFTLPGDTAGSQRYWDRDIISPEVTVSDGLVHLSGESGIGHDIDYEALDAFTEYKKVFSF